MMRNTLMMMGLIVLSSVSSAMAGAVQWAGFISNKTGNPAFNLTVPPNVNFDGKFFTAATTSGKGVFTGSLVFGSQTYNIFSGKIDRVSANALTFSVDQGSSSNDQNISFTASFTTGPFASWGAGDNAGLDSVLGGLLTSGELGEVTMVQLSGITQIGTYDGKIQAVPEPASALALLGIGIGMGVRYRRKLFAKKS